MAIAASIVLLTTMAATKTTMPATAETIAAIIVAIASLLHQPNSTRPPECTCGLEVVGKVWQ